MKLVPEAERVSMDLAGDMLRRRLDDGDSLAADLGARSEVDAFVAMLAIVSDEQLAALLDGYRAEAPHKVEKIEAMEEELARRRRAAPPGS
jgi:hypothetical protein